LILASINREGDSPLAVALFFISFAPHFRCPVLSLTGNYGIVSVRKIAMLRPAVDVEKRL
jgi:hypothetical protein